LKSFKILTLQSS